MRVQPKYTFFVMQIEIGEIVHISKRNKFKILARV